MLKLIPLNRTIEKNLILENVTYEEGDLIFVSGSIIEGIGNLKSDLDIFVVSKEFKIRKNYQIVYDNAGVKVTFKKIENIPCDIEYWPWEVLEEIIEQINNIDFNDLNKRTINQLKIPGYTIHQLSSFLHRFLIGKPLSNEKEFNRLSEKLNRDNYYKLMARVYIGFIDNDYSDIIGNLENNEVETSILIARSTLVKASIAYIFSKKKSINKEKWAYIHMRALAETDNVSMNIFNDYRSYLFKDLNTMTNKNLIMHVEDLLNFINHLIENAENNIDSY